MLEGSSLVIFFSLTEAPLPDPTQHPEMHPKQTRNRPETEPKQTQRSQTEPNGPETEPKWTEIKRSGVGQPGGFVGVGGGGCKGKRKSLL